MIYRIANKNIWPKRRKYLSDTITYNFAFNEFNRCFHYCFKFPSSVREFSLLSMIIKVQT